MIPTGLLMLVGAFATLLGVNFVVFARPIIRGIAPFYRTLFGPRSAVVTSVIGLRICGCLMAGVGAVLLVGGIAQIFAGQ